jgi:hypothetical protein
VCCRTPYCLDLEAAKAELLLLEAAQVKDLKMELAEMAAAAAADTGSQNLKELQATVAKFRLAASAAGVHVGDKAANGAQHAHAMPVWFPAGPLAVPCVLLTL